jgi:ParB family transcriptional regulator, chromosome partitioning protein
MSVNNKPRKGGLGSNPLTSGIFNKTESMSAAQSASIDSIKISAHQPRQYFSETAMAELISSVKAHGILQPLLVRPVGKNNEYELVAGERRYRAAKALGLAHVPVTVRQMSDSEAKQFALLENLQRQDLNPVEETEGVLDLLSVVLEQDRSSVVLLLSQSARSNADSSDTSTPEWQKVMEIFDTLALTPESFRVNRLPLLNLPSDILDAVKRGEIEYTKARAINMLPESEQRQELLKTAIGSGWSLQQIRSYVRDTKAANNTKNLSPSTETPDSQLSSVINRIRAQKAWENPTKWKKIQTLLKKIDDIIQF